MIPWPKLKVERGVDEKWIYFFEMSPIVGYYYCINLGYTPPPLDHTQELRARYS